MKNSSYNNIDYNKTASTGGLGDAFIVALKLRKLYKEGNKIDHLFIESSETTVDLIKQFFDCFIFLEDFQLNAVCDKDYYQNVLNGKYNERKFLNTSVCGDYNFPCVDNIKLEGDSCFISGETESYIMNNGGYDVCIQCSAGAKSNRNWKFDPISLVKLLRNNGYKVSIIGSDEKYFNKNDNDNFVNKTSLKESMNVIANSSIYVGLSGFHTFWLCSHRIKNIHFEIDSLHNEHYIPQEWNNYLLNVKTGTMSEVISCLRRLDISI